MKCIFITGIAGSGKTTLARYISEQFHIPHISVGQLLEERGQTDPFLKKNIDIGQPVPGSRINSLVEEKFTEIKSDVFIRDSKILNSDQLKAVNDFTLKHNIKNSIIYLDISLDIARERMSIRKRNIDIGDIGERRLQHDIQALENFENLKNIEEIHHINAEQELNIVQKEIHQIIKTIIN